MVFWSAVIISQDTTQRLHCHSYSTRTTVKQTKYSTFEINTMRLDVCCPNIIYVFVCLIIPAQPICLTSGEETLILSLEKEKACNVHKMEHTEICNMQCCLDFLGGHHLKLLIYNI